MATLGTFVAGQVLTAAELNAIGTWTDYSSSLSFTNLTVGNGVVNYARYAQINKLVVYQFNFTLGSTSSVSGLIQASLPVTAALYGSEPQVTVGVGRIYDASTGSVYWLVPYLVGDTTARLYVQNATSTYVFRSNTSSTVPMNPWATGDAIQAFMMYEAA